MNYDSSAPSTIFDLDLVEEEEDGEAVYEPAVGVTCFLDDHMGDGKPLSEWEYAYAAPNTRYKVSASVLMKDGMTWANLRCYSRDHIRRFYDSLKVVLVNAGIPLIEWSKINKSTTPTDLTTLSPSTIHSYRNVIMKAKTTIFIFLDANKKDIFKNYSIGYRYLLNYERSSPDGLGVLHQLESEYH